MLIKRLVNGETMVFELTPHELTDAYYEQEGNFDKADARCELETLLDGIRLPEEQLSSLAEEIAVRLRRNIDKCDMSWRCAMDEAADFVLGENNLL